MKKSQQLGVCWLSLRSASSLLTTRQRDIKDPGKCSNRPIDTAFCGTWRTAQDCLLNCVDNEDAGAWLTAWGGGAGLPLQSCYATAPSNSTQHPCNHSHCRANSHSDGSWSTCLLHTNPSSRNHCLQCQNAVKPLTAPSFLCTHRVCVCEHTLQNAENQHKPSPSETNTTHDVHTAVFTWTLIHGKSMFSLLFQDFVLRWNSWYAQNETAKVYMKCRAISSSWITITIFRHTSCKYIH